ALWHQGNLHVATHGVLNLNTGHKVQPQTMFQIGSITKPVTATLVMKLVEEGLIELDATVRTYIPEFRVADLDASKSITIKQLLDHSSGLGGDFFTNTGSGPDRHARYVERCALLPLCHPVGAGLSYSNSAFTIVGRVCEVVTRKTYDEALKHYLFGPMDLHHALSDPADIAALPVSSGHAPDPENQAKQKPLPTVFGLPISGAPAGSTPMMSIIDLVNFTRMHMDGGKAPNGKKILKQATVKSMRKIHNKVPIGLRDITHWGLGWFLVLGGKYFGHDGATIGQSSYLRAHEKSGTIAALLTNGGSATDLMIDLFDKTIDRLTGVAATPPLKPSKAKPETLDPYLGVYSTVAGDATIYMQDGQLMAKRFLRFDDTLIPEPPCPLEYAGDNIFLLTRPPSKTPAVWHFSQPDPAGRFQVLFTGLRILNRSD
ncbi:MAG: serine hydrolase domain-containing protein, partial [Pseudomonadota bacterium]